MKTDPLSRRGGEMGNRDRTLGGIEPGIEVLETGEVQALFALRRKRILGRLPTEGLAMQEEHVPTIIRLQQEWVRRRVIGPPPTWDGNRIRAGFCGVYAGPWPRWKRIIFRVTGASWCLPARLI